VTVSSWRDFLTWIESSILGNLIRDSGVWTYGVLNLLHIMGIAALFGSVLALDLRLLGWRRGLGLSGIASVTVPVATIGFGVAVASGICLLATNGSDYVGNPFLPIKFSAIALGLLNAIALKRLSAWKAIDKREPTRTESLQLAVMGGVSLLCWLTAISAGRMIGYW
jgi:hypothetical protein